MIRVWVRNLGLVGLYRIWDRVMVIVTLRVSKYFPVRVSLQGRWLSNG